jgi:hypothetical protein
MTFIKPVFPKAIFSWTDRVDEISNVFANDPNSLASEIISVEKTLGTNPQNESAPFSGTAVNYSSVNARITDTMLGNQHPYVSLLRENFFLTGRDGDGLEAVAISTYNRQYDPWNWYNGADVTIGSTGLYLIKARTTWDWFNQGFLLAHMYINGSDWESDLWPWEVFSPEHAPGRYAEGRWATTSLTWVGVLQEGMRVTVGLENGTNKSPYKIINNDLRVYTLRKMPSGTNLF